MSKESEQKDLNLKIETFCQAFTCIGSETFADEKINELLIACINERQGFLDACELLRNYFKFPIDRRSFYWYYKFNECDNSKTFVKKQACVSFCAFEVALIAQGCAGLLFEKRFL